MTKETPSSHFLKRSQVFLKGAIKETKEEAVLKAKIISTKRGEPNEFTED